jgi:hypothetical protein
VLVYEDFFLTKRYEFRIEDYQINVKADECETCFLDWPIDNYIKVSDLQNNKSYTIEFYTEGPKIEFGLNADKNELIINCPGFDTKFIDLKTLSEIELFDYGKIETKLSEFQIVTIINKKKELLELEKPRLPSNVWE